MSSPSPVIPVSLQWASPVCVDLDGTLVAGDLFWESLLSLVTTRPWMVMLLPIWLFRGRAYAKREVAKRVGINAASLNYRPEVLEFLRARRDEGHPLVLATAADDSHAHAVAQHLGIFSMVLASDGRVNLSGRHKADRLRTQFGADGFEYLGNDWVDIPSWKTAGRATIVAAPQALVKTLTRELQQVRVLVPGRSISRAVTRALRPFQWVKNLLVFVPLITSHRLLEPGLILQALLAFVAMCGCASGIYIINDLLDLQSDRTHPSKKRRPFASGQLSVPVGILLSVGCILTGLTVAALSSTPMLFGVLVLYLSVTIAYSSRIKREPVADVFVLAGLYVLRVVAGGIATGILISTWLLAFALFFFLSLALVKRYTEVAVRNGDLPGRAYKAADDRWMHSIGTTSGYMAVLVLALYINAPDVSPLYSRPRVLWLLCPILLYWLTRTWFNASRGRGEDDPLIEAFRDPSSYLLALCSALIFLAAV
jgi:4-hydroxybenzoate polyprenyltransferase